MISPEGSIHEQMGKIPAEERMDDQTIPAPTYRERLDESLRLWRARLIIPSGGLTAVATAVIATRLTSLLELVGISTFAGFLVGLCIGEGVAIGINHLQSRRSS